VNGNVELRLRALDAFWPWRFDERTHETLRPHQNQRGRNGVDRRQREDRSIIVVERCLMITVVLEHAVRAHVPMDHELGMSVVFTLVNVLGRSHRQQADGQAEYDRDDSGHPHT